MHTVVAELAPCAQRTVHTITRGVRLVAVVQIFPYHARDTQVAALALHRVRREEAIFELRCDHGDAWYLALQLCELLEERTREIYISAV